MVKLAAIAVVVGGCASSVPDGAINAADVRERAILADTIGHEIAFAIIFDRTAKAFTQVTGLHLSNRQARETWRSIRLWFVAERFACGRGDECLGVARYGQGRWDVIVVARPCILDTAIVHEIVHVLATEFGAYGEDYTHGNVRLFDSPGSVQVVAQDRLRWDGLCRD